MNPLTNVRNIQNLNKQELERGVPFQQSWHQQYRDSAWVFIGGLDYDLTEGDIICLFSQYGEITNINLVRDKKTGKSKGFAFLCYENQLSTVLSVDNLNSIKLCGRTIRVDHVEEYKVPKMREDMAPEQQKLALEGCAPALVDPLSNGGSLPSHQSGSSGSSYHKKSKRKDRSPDRSSTRQAEKVKEEPESPCRDNASSLAGGMVDDVLLPPRLFGASYTTEPSFENSDSKAKKAKKSKKEKKDEKRKKKKEKKKLKHRDFSSSTSSSSEEADGAHLRQLSRSNEIASRRGRDRSCDIPEVPSSSIDSSSAVRVKSEPSSDEDEVSAQDKNASQDPSGRSKLSSPDRRDRRDDRGRARDHRDRRKFEKNKSRLKEDEDFGNKRRKKENKSKRNDDIYREKRCYDHFTDDDEDARRTERNNGHRNIYDEHKRRRGNSSERQNASGRRKRDEDSRR